MEPLGELIPDKYELNARLRPALLLCLPALLVALAWIPELRSLGGALLTLAVTCGVTFLLAQVARRRGQALEGAWGAAIGREHSVRLLSAGDSEMRPSVKQKVIDLVCQYGPGFPTPAEEVVDPAAARNRRLDAIEWLLEATRADAGTSLLLAENIAYGFWRNLRGLKPVGIAIATLATAADIWLLAAVGKQDPRYFFGVAAGMFCLLAIIGWLFLVTRRQVEQASLTYAKRLFAQADNPSLLARLAQGAAAAQPEAKSKKSK